MDQQLSELVQVLLQALLSFLVAATPIVLTIAVQALRRYLRQLEERAAQDIGAANWEWIKDLTAVTIRAADQYRKMKGWEGEEAKDYVVAKITAAAAQHGIPLDPAAIDTLIEGTLNQIRTENQLWDVTKLPADSAAIEPA